MLPSTILMMPITVGQLHDGGGCEAGCSLGGVLAKSVG